MFKSFLIYLPVFFTLASPKYTVVGIPLTFILPTFFVLVNFFYINKMLLQKEFVKIFYIILLSAIFGFIYSALFSYIKLSSLFLFFVSVFLFMIYSSSVMKVLEENGKELYLVSKYLLMILVILMLIEVIFPNYFIKLRGFTYSPDNYEQLIINEKLRNEKFMGGIVRPLLFFGEPSHLSKLLGLSLLVIGIRNNFNINFLVLFSFVFLLARSPTIFIVLPFLLLSLISIIQGMSTRRLLVISTALFVVFSVIMYMIYLRVDGIIENGSGSLSERFIYPIMYMYEKGFFAFLIGYGPGGHGELYRYVYDAMAFTRPSWPETNNPITASSATLMFIGMYGLLGSALFLFLEQCLLKYSIYSVILLSSIFLTGYNSPSTWLVLSFILSVYIYYNEKKEKYV